MCAGIWGIAPHKIPPHPLPHAQPSAKHLHSLLSPITILPHRSSPHGRPSPPLGNWGGDSRIWGWWVPGTPAPPGCSSRWVFSLVATSLRGGTRVMKMDEAILFSAFPGNIAEAMEGPDRGLILGKIRKKE